MTDEYTTGARMTDASEVIIAIIVVSRDALVRIDDPHMWKGVTVQQLGQDVDTDRWTITKDKKVIITGWSRTKEGTDHGHRMRVYIWDQADPINRIGSKEADPSVILLRISGCRRSILEPAGPCRTPQWIKWWATISELLL